MASPSKPDGNLLQLQAITLDYGETRTLNHLNFALDRAEIHALVGEHGAGKSSLGMLIGGMLKPQSGQIFFERQAYRALTLQTAVNLGIEFVHQHRLALNPYFTVAENFFLTNTFLHFY